MIVRTLLSAFLMVMISDFTAHAQTSVVTGEISGLKEGDQIYLYEMLGSQLSVVDSTQVKNGKFEFKRENGFPRGFYRAGSDNQNATTLILSEESFSFKGSFKDPLNMHYEQSAENDHFKKFKVFNDKITQASQVIRQEFDALQNLPDPGTKQLELQQKVDSLNKTRTHFYLSLIEEGPDLYISKVARSLNKDFDTTKENFFDQQELTDDELARGDLLVGKVYNYFQKFVPRDLQSWMKASDDLIALTEEGSKQREIFYLALINIFASGAPDHFYSILKQYGNEFPTSVHYQYLASVIPPAPPQIGDTAPNIILPDQDGNMVQLTDLRGEYVLVDFWASWCGPCRQENPNIVRTFQKYKSKGFRVLGVSLDHKKESWLAAIEKDQLTWSHISDLKGWQSEGAALYQVRSIPASFLVDPDGKIIAKNLRGASLGQTLDELFNKEIEK